MVLHNTESKTLTTWEEQTTWETILAGSDVNEAAQFTRVDDLNEQFTDTKRWAYRLDHARDYDAGGDYTGDEDDDTAATVIAHESHLELDPELGFEPPMWWPDVKGMRVDKLTAYAGVRDLNRAEAATQLGLETNSVIESLNWLFDRPGLNKVATAAEVRRVNHWGVLGAVMAHTAVDIPPEVWTESETWGRGTFNLFVALCGNPGAGKGKTARLGQELVSRGANFVTAQQNAVTIGMVGSPEGMISALMARPVDTGEGTDEKATDSKAGATDNKVVDNRTETARVIFVIDEMNRLYGERRSTESTQEGTLLSMWSNEDIGALRKQAKDTLQVPGWSYRACFLVGAQPLWVHRLASETSAGLAQRWLYLPARTTHTVRPERGRKRDTKPPKLAGITVPKAVYTASKPVTIDNEVLDRMEHQAYLLEAADLDNRPVDSFKVHRAYNQARVAAVLSIIVNGRLEVTAEAWDLAAAVMDVSDLTRVSIRREYETTHKRDKIEEGATRLEINDAAHIEATAARILTILKDGFGGLTFSELRRRLSTKQRDVLDDALILLEAHGSLKYENIKDKNGKKTGERYEITAAGRKRA